MSDIRQIADKLYESDNEYISRREASLCVNAVVTGCESKETIEALAAVLVQIHHATPVDVEPVVHGRWVYSDEIRYMPQCTNCGAHPFKGYIPSVEEVSRTYKFCPCCGAKMDEKEDNTDE